MNPMGNFSVASLDLTSEKELEKAMEEKRAR